MEKIGNVSDFNGIDGTRPEMRFCPVVTENLLPGQACQARGDGGDGCLKGRVDLAVGISAGQVRQVGALMWPSLPGPAYVNVAVGQPPKNGRFCETCRLVPITS